MGGHKECDIGGDNILELDKKLDKISLFCV